MSDDTETNEEYDWHTDTELGLEEQIEKTKAEQPIARKQAKARRKQEERIAKKKGKLKKEQERLERLQEGTDTFCDRHPKICKAGKVAAVAGAVATSPIWVPEIGVDYVADKAKENVRPRSTRPRTQTVAKPRTTVSKTKTTTKRTVSTSKRSKPSQNARKPTQKRTTASKARKSTPKKKSPKKPKGSDWWGYGDAGL